MSLPTVRGTGTVITDPRTGSTGKGDPWCSAIVRFQTWRKTDDGWEPGNQLIAACIAFGDTARDLHTFTKNADIELIGTANVGLWNDKPQLQVTVTACRTPAKKTSGQRDELAERRSEARQRLARAHDTNPRLNRSTTAL